MRKKVFFCKLVPIFMKEDRLKIYIHQLKDGKCEQIEERVEPTFMDLEEEELKFEAPIDLKGEAFISGENFILRLEIQTDATMMCAICNEAVSIPIKVPLLTHSEKLEAVKAGLFHMEGVLREAILLELPPKPECNSGSCPEREHLKKYFSKEN